MRDKINENQSDRENLEASHVTAAACGLVVAFAALEFESDDFLPAELVYDFSGDFRSFDEWRAEVDVAAVTGCKDFAELDLVADFSFETIDFDLVASFDTVLLSTGFDN
jgi:hypothetical protein